MMKFFLWFLFVRMSYLYIDVKLEKKYDENQDKMIKFESDVENKLHNLENQIYLLKESNHNMMRDIAFMATSNLAKRKKPIL